MNTQNDCNGSAEKVLKNDKFNVIKKQKFIFIGCIALLIVGISIFFYIQSTRYVSTDDAYIDGHIVPISSKVSGNIEKVYVYDNQYVEQGKLIAELDSKDYKVEYDQALARLESAMAKQKSANVNINLTAITSNSDEKQASFAVKVAQSWIQIANKQIINAQTNLKQADNDVEAFNSDYDLAQIEYKRNESLLKKGGVSQKDMDKAANNLITAKNKLASSNEKVLAAKASLQSAYTNREAYIKSLNIAQEKARGTKTVKEKVAMSHYANKVAIAEIKQLAAALEQARLNLSYTKIYAPQSGNITNKNVEIGMYVQTGQPLLAIVSNKRWITANFKETQLEKIKAGQTVNIKIDTYPGKIFQGCVDSIQSASGAKSSLFPPENAVGSFVKVVQRIPVKIIFTETLDSKYNIVPGMSVIPEVKIQ